MEPKTISELAADIRKTYPGRFKNLSDEQLVTEYIKIRPGDINRLKKEDARKLGWNFAKKEFDKGIRYVKDKLQNVIPSDSTVKKTKQKVSDLIQKSKIDSTSTKETNVQKPQDNVVTKIVTQYPLPPKSTQAFKTKPCDENTFPWTKGCMNNKIGQMNLVYFGDRYNNIYGDELFQELYSLGYFKAPGQKVGEISQYIYDEVMKDSLQEGSKTNRKKVIKETVKKVLKERLKKK